MFSKDILKDKIRGCFFGIAIGDALGKPIEMKTAKEIAENWGRIENYFVNVNHKYYDGMPAGSTTDDLQLTLAVARAFIARGEFDLDTIAEEHCNEFMLNVSGWGTTTREAVARMVDGKHWSEAALSVKTGMGTGNGVAMKVSPVGLYMSLTNPNCNQPQFSQDIKKLVNFAIMTHFTSMAIISGFVQAFAVAKCFSSEANNFDVESFIRTVIGASKIGRRYLFQQNSADDLPARLELLTNHHEYNTERIITDFKGGSYVYESQPFALMFFVKNPLSIDSMYDCITAGGDTDSTGSMIGALLGALHGTKIFPKHLIDGLQQKDMILETADKFFKKFPN
jgi:ADP-ribosylglycohydrolase